MFHEMGRLPLESIDLYLSLQEAIPGSPDEMVIEKDYEEAMADYDGTSESGALVSG